MLPRFLKVNFNLKVLIFCLAILVYLPALQGGYIWDDDEYVTENRTLRSIQGLKDIWLTPGATPQYYPLVFSSFWIEYHLWGLHPMGYHITNLILHLLAGWLLWLCLVRLDVPAAGLAALVFILHPVNVESVAWITERKNVLSLVLYLGSAFFLIRYFNLEQGEPVPRSKWSGYVPALALFVAALLSKTVTFSLPSAMLLLIWWRRGRIRVRELMVLIPFLALGLAAGLTTAWLEQHYVGAQGFEWDYTMMERILIAGRVIWFYTAKLLLPVQLMFNYPRWSVDGSVWWQYLYPGALVILIAVLWRHRQSFGRGPLTGALFFCGTLFPALGFIDVYPFRYSFVADHFQYHAGIGLIVLVVAAGTLILNMAPLMVKHMLIVLFLLLLAGRAHYQSYDYAALETLWRRTLQKNPRSWIAHNNLGVMLRARGEDEKALAHYLAALEAQPRYTEALNNLGSYYADKDHHEQALFYYHKAIDQDPDNAMAYKNLSQTQWLLGEHDSARKNFQRLKAISVEQAVLLEQLIPGIGIVE